MNRTFLELVRSRRSVRRYESKPVEREKIKACLEAAWLSPSASNVQPWRFLVVDDVDLKDSLCAGAFSGIYSVSKFASEAPVIVVILALPNFVTNRLGSQVQGNQFYLLDIGIAGEHFVLQAESLGLGTCWVGWFNKRRVRKTLGIPKRYKIVAMLSLGYVGKKPGRERKLKNFEEIFWFNKVGRSEESEECTPGD
jgi:nitroreductase